MIYRVKQFLWGISAKVPEEDVKLIGKYLDEYEKSIFYRLPRYEQVHSIKVAKKVTQECFRLGISSNSLIKAAFLHDVGKIGGGLNLITKSIMVILDKILPSQLRKMTRFNLVDAYYNHPDRAVSLLRYKDGRINFLILNHHNKAIHGDKELSILQEADSNS